MEIGIFAKIFQRLDLDATLDAVQAHDIHFVQFNMACAGLPTLPEYVSIEMSDRIVHAATARHITLSALSGTFNMIDPNLEARVEGLNRLKVLIQTAKRMAIPIITICTGTRNPQNMWRRHPDNTTKEAWTDLLVSMEVAVKMAEDNNIVLGVEPELSNVIDSALKARRLLDNLRSPHVKVVMDGSNLLSIHDLDNMHPILEHAFDLLGNDICLVHAKDLMPGEIEGHGAAGSGVLDYDLYLTLLRKIGYIGPLILHTLREDEVEASKAFIRSKLASRTL